ncbi:hypothetical protein DERP_005486, partial [Dermatophagoides pteronyssinus]
IDHFDNEFNLPDACNSSKNCINNSRFKRFCLSCIRFVHILRLRNCFASLRSFLDNSATASSKISLRSFSALKNCLRSGWERNFSKRISFPTIFNVFSQLALLEIFFSHLLGCFVVVVGGIDSGNESDFGVVVSEINPELSSFESFEFELSNCFSTLLFDV